MLREIASAVGVCMFVYVYVAEGDRKRGICMYVYVAEGHRKRGMRMCV